MDAHSTTVRQETAAALRGFAAPAALLAALHGLLAVPALHSAAPAAFELVRQAWLFAAWALVAWGLYRGLQLLARWVEAAPPRPSAPDAAAAPAVEIDQTLEMPPRAAPHEARKHPAAPLQARLRSALRAGRALEALELRGELAKALPAERLAKLDTRLGSWLTKKFQRGLREGRATELLPVLEAAAAAYAEHETFRYFQEILPTVRQAAELKAAALADEEDDDGPPAHHLNGRPH